MVDLEGVKEGAVSHARRGPGSAVSALAYAGAAILGIVAANYFGDAGLGLWYTLAGGAAIFLVPIFLLHDNSGYMGPVRMFLAVTGLTLMLRAVTGNGTTNSGLVNVPWPNEVGAVI